MVRGLDGDDIGAEIRPQQQTQSFDDVGSLGLASGETELSELLVRLQHDQVRSKHHTRRLLLVVVDLDGRVVGNSERDDFGFVPLYRGSRTGCGCGREATITTYWCTCDAITSIL